MMEIKPDLLIGIDPGSNGALAIYRNDNVEIKRMPKDILELSGYFQHVNDISERPLVFIEKQDFWGSDITGGKIFNIKHLVIGYEKILMLLSQANIPYIMVAPMKWQGKNGLGVKQKNENPIEVKRVFDGKMFKRAEKGLKTTKDQMLKMEKDAEKQVRKNRYKNIAQKYYPMINVTLLDADALLIMHFGRMMCYSQPRWVLDNMPTDYRDLFKNNL